LAMPLARRSGLQGLDPVDSQYEAVRTLALPETVLEEALRQAWGEEWRLAAVIWKNPPYAFASLLKTRRRGARWAYPATSACAMACRRC